MILQKHKMEGAPKKFRDAAEVLATHANKEGWGFDLLIRTSTTDSLSVCAWDMHRNSHDMRPWADIPAIKGLPAGVVLEKYAVGVMITAKEEKEETPNLHVEHPAPGK